MSTEVGQGEKEEKRPGAMRAPLRPRFQRPRTQLVHLLLDVQPPARVPGRWFCRLDSTVCILQCTARRALDVNPPGIRENEIWNIENKKARLRSDDRNDRPHLWVLSSRHRHVDDEHDCTPDKKCARSWCDYRS